MQNGFCQCDHLLNTTKILIPAFEETATDCTRIIMQDFLTSNWEETKSQLLQATDISGRCPIHIAARRGFDGILELLIESCSISEGITGYTALHIAASLGMIKIYLNLIYLMG